jgi:hypothetical protein
MNSHIRTLLFVFALGLTLSGLPEPVYAYGGPGSVISGIGTLLAALAALIATLFGFVWFPLKRLYAKLTQDSAEEEEPA